MTTEDKIAVMQAHLDGKTIECKPHNETKWVTAHFEPYWNWEYMEYRIKPEGKPEPKPLLYEWWCKVQDIVHISTVLRTEEEAHIQFASYKYGVTGRYFDPNTNEFKTSII